MTEHNHSHGSTGGHEVDQPPTRELFNIVWGLSGLTLLSCLTCVQLFNDQARDLGGERGDVGSHVLKKYREESQERTVKAGKEQLTDVTGKVVARYDYIPLASARDLILAKPEKLGAFPPPPGWMHPDDVAAGGQGGAPAAPPAPPPAAPPADGAPAAPADGAPAGIGGPAPTGTPPAGTPPAVNPPVGTPPPVATPPIVPPPAGTPAPAPAVPAPAAK